MSVVISSRRGVAFVNGVAVPNDPVSIRRALASQPITAFQGKVVLHRRGMIEAAEAIATAAGGETLFAWERAQEWRRDSPTITGLGAALGLSGEQIDDLFIEAAGVAL
jgi:hypothetical protein